MTRSVDPYYIVAGDLAQMIGCRIGNARVEGHDKVLSE